MEVVGTEEKKKIFRARKTMKISDRQQLESLHSTLLSAAPGLSNPSPPPLMNGTHKEDGQKAGDKEQNNISDSNSPNATSPASPAPFLSLNLSPSPGSSQSPKAKDESPTTSPTSPFHSINFELKKMDDTEEEKKGSLLPSLSDAVTLAPTKSKENQEKDTEMIPEVEKKEEKQTTAEIPAVDSKKDSTKGLVPCSPLPPPVSDCTKPVDTDSDATKAADPEASAAKIKDEKPSSPRSITSDSSPSCSSSSHPASSSAADLTQVKEIKKDNVKEEKDNKEDVKKGSVGEEKMEVDSVKVETKVKKPSIGKITKPSRPLSTPPSNAVQEDKGSTSGVKRTLSEGSEKDGQTVKREGKRPKVDREELEAQLEFKITAKAGSHHKLEKIVQQLVDERLRVLELTIFDKHFQELKDRVDKLDCSTKHQTVINTIQAKIARLAKKFGEANQASENKRKQEALVAAAAAATAAATAAVTAASAAKTAAVAHSPQVQRPVRTSMELKQISTVSSSTQAVNLAQTALSASVPASVTTSTSTTMVQQAPILQLITSSANAANTLATGITTQSPTGTLLLKAGPGNSMMASGQPLLIQLANGQAGTLVNFPVSSLSAANSLNKGKTTASTTTYILKPAPNITTTSASTPGAATVSALQASPGQFPSGQISLARAVYQGGAGGITTPNAGVSITTARTPAQSISLAGAMSSASSPATSGPAATGSTAPGPPQGTSLTSKTDNQAAAATPSKAPTARPKGSVIDLTEDDDDVQVTGVKNAIVAAPSPTQRPLPTVSLVNSTGARLSPHSSPQVTVHHRPPLDSPMKPRPVTTTTPTRVSVLPPLPVAPVPSRLPPEAERTTPPQQPQLKLVPSQTGIVLSWCVSETDRTCAAVDSYHLYAFHQDNSSSNVLQQHWKKIGEVKALPLPMACTLTQFQSGSTYHFAVRARDIYGRFGSFCEPQCTNVISASSS